MIRCKWEPGVIYDQGKTSTCTGHAWAAALRCKWGADTDSPLDLYNAGFKRQYGEGTGFGQRGLNLKYVAEALIEGGLIQGIESFTLTGVGTEAGAYRLIAPELQKSPLLISVPWYQGFNHHEGLHMEPTGRVVGNHLMVVLDACSVRGLVIQNSFGPSWGDQGRKFLKWRTLIALFRSDQAYLTTIHF